MNTVPGDDFNNSLFGSDLDDLYLGLGGNDFLFPSRGNDTLDGGSDRDVALYDVGLFTNGVFINNTDTAIGALLAFTVDKRGFGTDTLIDVSNFHGTQYDDTIYVGGLGDTYTIDRAGDDLIVASQDPNAVDNHFFVAGSGNDTLIGTVERDTVDYLGSDNADAAGPITQGVDVDLAAGTAVDGWGDQDTLVSVERVYATNFDDTLRGDDGRNDFEGRAGDDFIDGRGGDRDRVRYDRTDPSGIDADLATGTVIDGFGDTDTLVNIERITGSQHADIIRGDENDNSLVGKGGADLIEGRGGNDNFEGGAGNDTIDGGDGEYDRVSYGDEDGNGAVVVDLAAGTATDSFGDTDTLISIERVDGTELDDILRGDDNYNDLVGGAGDDRLEGRGGGDYFEGNAGNDTIDGGDGDADQVSYLSEDGLGAVDVDLAAGTATDSFGDSDTLISIEHVDGTELADVLLGDENDNELKGRAGDDTIEGRGGEDYIDGGAGDDDLSGGDGRDSFRGSQGDDTIDGGASFAEFSGGDDVAYDEEHEHGGLLGINVDLSTGIATDTFGDTDTLVSIEGIRGSIFDDTIRGTADDEELRGNDGDDLIVSGGGDDYLDGGRGDDTIIGGVGGEYIRPGLGADIINAGENGTTGEEDHLSYRDGPDNAPSSGVNVVFSSENAGTVVDHGGDTDTFSGIEIVEGTYANDTFYGAEGDQEFRGYGGDDYFDGGAGDNDELDYRHGDEDDAIGGITVNMVAGTATDNFGGTDTFVNIEKIEGSIFDDVITGDTNRNNLRGREGNDLIDSFGGVDNQLDGGRGNDTIHARGDSDGVNAGDGNDLITFYGEGGYANPGLGSDTIVGGTEGFFSIGYDRVGTNLTIDVELRTTTFAGSTDVDSFTNIVNIRGGDGNDTLLGNDGERQEFFSSLGDDFVDGRGDGDEGDRDWLIYDWGWTDDYSDADRAMVVNFTLGTAVGALAGNDTFQNIEAVRGSRADDHFIGSDQAYEEYQGMAGNDTIEGGGGLDRLSYSFEDNRGGTQGITIDLAATPNADGFLEVTDSFGDTDYVSGIEQVTGTAFGDVISGGDEDNVLIGIEGNDTLVGRGGDDFLWGGEDADSLTGGAGADEFGGFIGLLDGDTITDFSAEDRITIFDENFNELAANASIVGNELRIDTDGDGEADATMFLENGYTGAVNVSGGPIGGPVPTVFSVDDAGLFTTAVDESAQAANVTIRRSGDLTSSATVQVTMSGTGANPISEEDVTTPFNRAITLQFGPGVEQLIYQIGIIDDTTIEAAEDLVFTLSNPTSDGAGGAEISGAETYVRVFNNDFPASVRIDGEKRLEDAGELVFTVSRSGDLSEALTVPYEVKSGGGLLSAEDDDIVGGLPQSGNVVIAAGASQASFVIQVAPDATPELHDNLVATISATSDWPDGLTVDTAQATGSIRNDDGVPPVLPVGATGSSFGDPHIVTLDGLAYDFQAVGEFTLLEALSGDPLNIQVRYAPVAGSQVASQTVAVATQMGTAQVMVDAGGVVTIDGSSFDLSSASGGVSIGNGDIYFDGEAMTLVYASGEQLRIDFHDGFLTTSVSIAANRDVGGLLGNGDGDTSNDLALRDGTVLTQPISHEDLYGAFADAWRLTDANSLFDYASGQSTADFTDPDFPAASLSLDDFPTEVVAAAEALVSEIDDPALRDAALVDYLLSGNVEFIEAARVVDEVAEDPTAELTPTDAPEILSAIGITANVAEVTEGDGGGQLVDFTVYRSGDISDAVSVDFTVSGTADGADFVGDMGGTLSFEAGQGSENLSFDILGDSIVEDNETLVVTLTETTNSPLFLSSIAEVTIVNDDLAPPEPLLNEVNGTNGRDNLLGTDGDDAIRSFAGSYDRMRGGDGADQFIFGAETQNGVRERDLILDFEVGVDTIVFEDGATVGAIREARDVVVIFMEDDRDAIYVRGEGVNADNISIITDNGFEFI